MKKSNIFKNRSVKVPKFHWRNKSHSVYTAMPFGRVVPTFWSDMAPNEAFKIGEGTKLLTSPFVGPQLSNMSIKTRYFCVPLRKVVPSFVDFKLSDPSDNITTFHTTIYNIFRGACYSTSQYRNFYYECIKADGLANYIGVPFLLDQLCCIIFGKDLAYMEEFKAALEAAGCVLANGGSFATFEDFFTSCLLGPASSYTDQAFHYNTMFAWYKVATGGTAPNYEYTPQNLAYYSQDSLPFYYLDFNKFMLDNGTSWENIITDIYNDNANHSFSEYIIDNHSNEDTFTSDSVLSDVSKGDDNTDTFFGTPLRMAPFLAYQKIKYDWFVDLRLNDNVFEELCNHYEQANVNQSYLKWTDTFNYVSSLSGSSVTVNILGFLLSSFMVDYMKDYFTTCAFEPQMGDDLVIGPNGKLPLMFEVDSTGVSGDKVIVTKEGYSVNTGDAGQLKLVKNTSPFPAIGKVWAQINESDEITPIKLRWQMAFQSLKESRNIGGYSRYTDFALGQYGIRIPDPYLQRSIYLGGFRTPINTDEVVARADGQSVEGSSMLGDVGAYGRGYSRSPLLRGHVKEHCIVMGLTYIVPQNYYTQGIPTRLTDIHVLDFPHFQFKNVGEQPVLNREIFLGAKPSDVFGYQKRYSDKMFMFDEIHGEFLTNLRYFHTGRKFMSQPLLNQALLTLRGSDGHDDILAVRPDVAMPFRIDKHIYFMHKMCV